MRFNFSFLCLFLKFELGMPLFHTASTIPGPSSSGNGMLPDDESRKQRKLEAEEASISEYYADTTQLGFSDISGEKIM